MTGGVVISIRDNFPSVARTIDLIGKQAQFAAAVALTRTAKHAQSAWREQFRQHFDRPTPFVMKSIFVQPAKPQNLSAGCFLKTRDFGQATQAASDYLDHHFSGGARTAKQLERRMRAEHFLEPNEFLVPGIGARLDKYGNISRGQLTQMASQLRLRISGVDTAPTKSRRSRRNVARAGRMFWSFGRGSFGPGTFSTAHGGRPQNLPKGAWVEKAGKLQPVVLAVVRPLYRKRFDLVGLAGRTVKQHFKPEFDRALRAALASAR